jgi:hypothetical protein
MSNFAASFADYLKISASPTKKESKHVLIGHFVWSLKITINSKATFGLLIFWINI